MGRRHRCVVLDPACVQTFGHNVAALCYFAGQVENIGFESTKVASTDLGPDIANSLQIKRYFTNYYAEFLGRKKGRVPGRPHQELLALSLVEARAYLAQMNFTKRDVLFFPSADYYGTHGFLTALQELNEATAPSLFLRFIGVLENANQGNGDALASLSVLIVQARQRGFNIQLSSETPIYSELLTERVHSVVPVVPYPAVAGLNPLPRGTEFSVFCPGAARFDKGYLRLLGIIALVKKFDALNAIKFTLQEIEHEAGAIQFGYTTRLYAMPGTTLLESAIDSAQIEALYKAAHIVLMPYDIETYRLRGSAVLMEAIGFGRTVIASDHTGFADQIRFYRCGTLCSTDEEFARAILDAAVTDTTTLERRACQARARFSADTAHTMNTWMSLHG